MDAIAVAFFVLLWRWFRTFRIKEIVTRHEQNVLPSKFSVQVDGLPRRIAEHTCFAAFLSDHFAIFYELSRLDGWTKDFSIEVRTAWRKLLRRASWRGGLVRITGGLKQLAKQAELQKKLSVLNVGIETPTRWRFQLKKCIESAPVQLADDSGKR